MKKILAIILATISILTLVACSQKEQTKNNVLTIKMSEGQVMYDENDVKITLGDLKEIKEQNKLELSLTIKNNRKEDITVQIRNQAINNSNVFAVISSDVPAGEKIEDNISFFTENLEDLDIDFEDIKNIYFDFHVFYEDEDEDEDETKYFEDKSINIEFPLEKEKKSKPATKKELYDDKFVRISYIEISGSYLIPDSYKSVKLLIENKSSSSIFVSTADYIINSEAVDETSIGDINGKRNAIFEVDIPKDIDNIHDLECIFKIRPDGEKSYKTESIKFNID